MRWLAILVILMSPTVASGQDYTFGDWARDHGYSPGHVMPGMVRAEATSPAIDSLDGIGEFDWASTPTHVLDLRVNQISSIESGAFSGLTDLTTLVLHYNQISSIESGDFSGLTILRTLYLNNNQISSIESGAFSGLTNLESLVLGENQISSIESSDFDGLTSLNELILDSNQISSIESVDFSGLTNLRTLGLGHNQISSVESGTFNGLTNLGQLLLGGNQISSIESVDFSGLANLWRLDLRENRLSSIPSGAFSGLTNLDWLELGDNIALTELNLAEADFSSLGRFDVTDNANIGSVSLKDARLNQTALVSLLEGNGVLFIDDGQLAFKAFTGIGELDGITEMDLSGIDFIDITDLEPLYVMDDLTDLWLVDTLNVDASDLDVLLDNLETIEGTDIEGILYMTQTDFDAFNTAGGGLLAAWDVEPGHHVEFLQIGDVNHDTEVNGLDVDSFVNVLLANRFDVAADMNGDGAVNGLDVDPFVADVVGGTQPVPEPSALVLAMVMLGLLVGWRKWRCGWITAFTVLSFLTTAFIPPATAAIYRWDNGEMITEKDAEPRADLSEMDLRYADLAGASLSGASFLESDLTNAHLMGADLTDARFPSTMLTGVDLKGANLTDVIFQIATLTDADLSGAVVRGATFMETTNRGFTREQLYSTASYQIGDLIGIDFWANDLSGWDFAGKNLTDARFLFSTLADVDFKGANLTNAQFGCASCTDQTILTGADFSGAVVRGANFAAATSFGFTAEQLYSTASYENGDLREIEWSGTDLSGWDFSGKSLIGAQFFDLMVPFPVLTGTDFSRSDLRGVNLWLESLSAASTRGMIWPDGRLEQLMLRAGEQMMIRDHNGEGYCGLPNCTPGDFIPITVESIMTLDSAASLRMVFEDGDWASTISFEPAIPVTLDGTLELTFADISPASLIGTTFDLFNWDGVTPTGTFAEIVTEAEAVWDTSNLYTTGEVTLLFAVPEPSTSILALVCSIALFVQYRRRKRRKRRLTPFWGSGGL